MNLKKLSTFLLAIGFILQVWPALSMKRVKKDKKKRFAQFKPNFTLAGFFSNCSADDQDDLDLNPVAKKKQHPKSPKRTRDLKYEEIGSPIKIQKTNQVFDKTSFTPQLKQMKQNHELKQVFESGLAQGEQVQREEHAQDMQDIQEIKERQKIEALLAQKMLSFEQFCKQFEDAKKSKDRESLNAKEFTSAVYACIDTVKKQELGVAQNWIGHTVPDNSFFALHTQSKNRFFGQKMLLEAQEKPYEFFVFGDRHGDADSLIDWMRLFVKEGYLQQDNPFAIAKDKKHVRLVFLGDYVDRGMYSVELLYLIMRLKIANPSQVIILRGNHEDASQNKSFDLLVKTQEAFGTRGSMTTLYNMFPTCVFVGVKNNKSVDPIPYVLFCHGGLEPRFNPHLLLSDKRNFVCQWIDTLDISWLSKINSSLAKKIVDYIGRKGAKVDFAERIDSPFKAKQIGFIWNDFVVDDGHKFMDSVPERGGMVFAYGQLVTQSLLRAYAGDGYEVTVSVTAHQHSDKQMRSLMIKSAGLYNSWAPVLKDCEKKLTEEFPVWTLNAAPNDYAHNKEGGRGHYQYDTCACLKLDSNFKNWSLQAINLQTFVRAYKEK